MSALAPVDAASCRAMAVECGRRANKFFAQGMTSSAMREIDRARELTLMGLKFEIAEQNSLSTPTPSPDSDTAGAGATAPAVQPTGAA